MNNLGTRILSLAAPFLILLAVIGLLMREETDRLQALPALFVGIGLTISNTLGRRNQRAKLLLALRSSKLEEN